MKTGIAKEDVLTRLSAYFPPEKFDQFVENNKEAIDLMMAGSWSPALTFYKRENNEEYQARVKFTQVKDKQTGKTYLRTDFRFANRELSIADVITYNNAKIPIPKNLQDELRETGRLKNAVSYVDANGNDQKVIIAVDQDLNRLCFINPARYKNVKHIYNTPLMEDQPERLLNGEIVFVDLTFAGKREPVRLGAYIDSVSERIRLMNPGDGQQVQKQNTATAQKIEKSEALKQTEKQLGGSKKQLSKDNKHKPSI